MPSSTTVECVTTPEDQLAFNLYNCLHHSRAWRRRWMLTQIGGRGLVLVLLTVVCYLMNVDWMIAFLGGGCILVLLLLALHPMSMRRYIRKSVKAACARPENASKLGRCRISLSPEGVVDANDFGEMRVSWKGINAVVERDEHLFLYDSAEGAIIVPRRAFPNEKSWRLFVETAHDYHELQRPSPRSAENKEHGNHL